MTRFLGIDIGFGYTKAHFGIQDADGNDSVVSFRTVVTNAIEAGGFSPHSCIEVDGNKFYAGPDVSGEDPYYDPRNSEFLGSAHWTALLVAVIRACNFNTYDSTIVLGIPAAQFSKKKSAELIHALKQKCITINGTRFDLGSTDIYFVPQGFGIYLKYVSDNSTNFKSLRVAVVDIGFHTLDLITMNNGKFVNTHVKTYPLGISVLLDDIDNEFNRKYLRPIGRDRAMSFLGNREVQWSGEVFELDIDEITKNYSARVAALINNYMEGQVMDLGIAGGGGVHVLRKVMKLKKKLYTVASPENANAIGYWIYGTQYK